METITNTSDNIITNSYKEYHQVILTYITYRITHRYEAEDLAQDVFVRLLDYKQMLRPDTVKYFLFAIARNIVTDYIRRYYKKQEIDSYMYDFAVTSSNETEEAIIADDLASAEQRRLAIFPEQRRIPASRRNPDRSPLKETGRFRNVPTVSFRPRRLCSCSCLRLEPAAQGKKPRLPRRTTANKTMRRKAHKKCSFFCVRAYATSHHVNALKAARIPEAGRENAAGMA